jgi:hypothetical protein
MLWPLLESLIAAVPLLPRELFNGAAVTEILSIARSVRGSVDVFGFECRLLENADRVDLGVLLLPTPEEIDGIPGRRSQRSDRATRSRLRALMRDPASFRRLVSCVYLEYDANGSRRAVIPSVFLSLNDGRLEARRLSMAPQPAEVEKLLLAFMGRDRFASCERTLARCFAELPRAGRVLVAGAMLGRSPQTAHVSVSLPRSRVRGYLGALGSSVCRDVSHVVENLDPRTESVLLDFDVALRSARGWVSTSQRGVSAEFGICARASSSSACARRRRKTRYSLGPEPTSCGCGSAAGPAASSAISTT